ncbi:hypothetical protein KSS87_016932, partial [Heliosperma pusillum]
PYQNLSTIDRKHQINLTIHLTYNPKLIYTFTYNCFGFVYIVSSFFFFVPYLRNNNIFTCFHFGLLSGVLMML